MVYFDFLLILATAAVVHAGKPDIVGIIDALSALCCVVLIVPRGVVETIPARRPGETKAPQTFLILSFEKNRLCYSSPKTICPPGRGRRMLLLGVLLAHVTVVCCLRREPLISYLLKPFTAFMLPA